MARKQVKTNDELSKRVNISIRDDVKAKAKHIGGGNVSKGLAMAIKMASDQLKTNDELSKRVNISIRDDVKAKAKRLGGGNVSKGLAIAVAQYQMSAK